jgi:chromosome segregation ATPase
MVVSAAHEMLHGAYERLSRPERKKIDAAIEQAYAGIDDPQLTDLVASYEITEPGERLNELHSILATREKTLPPVLERYYRRYFTNRHRIVAAFQSYDQVFTALEQQHAQLQAQLDALDIQLDEALARKDAAIARTDELLVQIESLREQGRIAESNDLVDPQNAAADDAGASVDTYNALVDQYNAVVEQYNAVVDSARELYDSVSAVPVAPPAS